MITDKTRLAELLENIEEKLQALQNEFPVYGDTEKKLSAIKQLVWEAQEEAEK